MRYLATIPISRCSASGGITGEGRGQCGSGTAYRDGASLFINIGTPTQVATPALACHRYSLVITNNRNVGDTLHYTPSIEILTAGGQIRVADLAVFDAMDFIRGFNADFSIIGASGIDCDGTLLDFDVDEVSVAQTIIAQTRQVILVADGTSVIASARPDPDRRTRCDRQFRDRPLP